MAFEFKMITGPRWTEEQQKWMDEGWNSFDNDPFNECPYEPNTEAYVYWQDGFSIAVENHISNTEIDLYNE